MLACSKSVFSPVCRYACCLCDCRYKHWISPSITTNSPHIQKRLQQMLQQSFPIAGSNSFISKYKIRMMITMKSLKRDCKGPSARDNHTNCQGTWWNGWSWWCINLILTVPCTFNKEINQQKTTKTTVITPRQHVLTLSYDFESMRCAMPPRYASGIALLHSLYGSIKKVSVVCTLWR